MAELTKRGINLGFPRLHDSGVFSRDHRLLLGTASTQEQSIIKEVSVLNPKPTLNPKPFKL